MKKLILGMSLLVASVATAFAASITEDNFSGARVGLGYSQTSLKAVRDDGTSFDSNPDGKALKVELGYDINRIFGLDASYQNQNEIIKNISNNPDSEGSTIKVGADIGYAFYSKNVFLKPYVKVGFVSFSENNYDENSLFAGLGLRYQYNHLYADLSIDGFYLDDDRNNNYDYYEFVQTALTVGYKF